MVNRLVIGDEIGFVVCEKIASLSRLGVKQINIDLVQKLSFLDDIARIIVKLRLVTYKHEYPDHQHRKGAKPGVKRSGVVKDRSDMFYPHRHPGMNDFSV